MRIHALAVDYDGTIAQRGKVAAETQAALDQLRRGGRRLLLVTGRRLDDLEVVAPELTLFDSVVAENGAVLYDPKGRSLTVLGERPPAEFVTALERQRVPFEAGHVVVGTEVPHDGEVLQVIHALGLEWQVIYNKGSVMALPAGVTKASGLLAALDTLNISPHNIAGIGDAENDHSFLRICEVAGATGNALDAIKRRAALVMRRANGRGVTEFIERHLLEDFVSTPRVFDGYRVELGVTRTGAPVHTPVYGASLLILGDSGSGKSTLTGVLVERLAEQGYQVCLIDPEGDHGGLDPLITIGSTAARPALEEIESALERASAGVTVNLVSLTSAEKARFAADLLSVVLAMRSARGRPHWIVIDEAHHLLPADGSPGASLLSPEIDRVCLVTLRADLLPSAVLQCSSHLYVVDPDAAATLERFAERSGIALPEGVRKADLSLLEGEAMAVTVRSGRAGRPARFRVATRRTSHQRHARKYAGGDLGDSSFYFRGPDKRLNLRAYNVTAFVEMARGVDDATWTHHLKRGDYSTWFRDKIKDPELAGRIAAVEAAADTLTPQASRDGVLRLVEGRYTAGG